ncbi:MAG: redoxin domain-containing protein, partial [Deltaproteobacteria bacterium]
MALAPPACSGDSDPSDSEAPKLAPDFELLDLQGDRVSLASFRGRTLLIDFWATWCAPCVFQIPVLNEFYAKHKDDGVAVLGISIDADPEEVIPPFLAENPIRYPVLLGDEGLARRYGQLNGEDVFQMFINAYTTSIDPHTAYFSPRTSENFKIRMSLSLEGIGAVLQSEN